MGKVNVGIFDPGENRESKSKRVPERPSVPEVCGMVCK